MLESIFLFPMWKIWKNPSCRAALAFAAALVLMLGHSSFAFECKSVQAKSAAPQVTLSVDPGKVLIDNDRNQGELARINRQTGGASPGGGQWSLLGLTVTEFKFNMRVNVLVYPLPGGQHCAILESLTSSIGYPQFTIHVERKYRFGSCQHRVIRAHEDFHVGIYRKNLQRYAPLIEQTLAAASRQLEPVLASSQNDGAEAVKNRLKTKIAPLLTEMQRNVADENAIIDAKEAYQTLKRSCANW